MKKDKIGACSANLYAQFLYRIMMIKEQYNLTNYAVALFCKPNYLSGETYKIFRKKWLSNFEYSSGVLFNASHFANVSALWGINFTIWKSGETECKNNFMHTLIDVVNDNIDVVGEKNIYNLDGLIFASDWVKSQNVGERTLEIPTMSSGLKIGMKSLKTNENIKGWFTNGNNNIYNNSEDVYIMSCPNGRGKTNVAITSDNILCCTALFAARKLIVGNWINDKDEYLAPNEEHPSYNEFVNDSIVYSLFHSASNQSSLRQVEYKGKKWDIKNEFFFMSKNDIMQLASDNGFDFTFNDAMVSNERYVYTKLQGIELSQEAKAVLDMAIELTKASFKYRGMFDEEHPEYQIMNWDCGWYQIKGMLKEYMPNALKEFNELFKALGDKMRPMVYELGFLK